MAELFVQIMGCGVRDGTGMGFGGWGDRPAPPADAWNLDIPPVDRLYIHHRMDRHGADRRISGEATCGQHGCG